MNLDKKSIQEEVEATLSSGRYTEKLGHIFLLFADITVNKKGLNYRYGQFEIDFIVKPKIVDMLLLKVFKYKKEHSSAYTFLSLITTMAVIDAANDIRRASKGDSLNVFYIEDLGKEISSMDNGEDYCLGQDVYIENSLIKLK